MGLLINFLKPRVKGFLGEVVVSTRLKMFDSTEYIVLNDLSLPSEGSVNTTQIDHVVVSNFGVFCIETKNYSGWIFGRKKDKYWTQTMNPRSKKKIL